jgi:hypothetical protein
MTMPGAIHNHHNTQTNTRTPHLNLLMLAEVDGETKNPPKTNIPTIPPGLEAMLRRPVRAVRTTPASPTQLDLRQAIEEDTEAAEAAAAALGAVSLITVVVVVTVALIFRTSSGLPPTTGRLSNPSIQKIR